MPTQEAAQVHELIQNRWSPKSFRDQPISPEDLHTILEAGKWAASSYNEQPWRFVVATKKDGPAYDRLLHLLMPANQSWAKNAAVLMITAAKKQFSHNGSPNAYAMHDAGQALANMMLQATALGLHAHAMGGFDRQAARTVLGIPDDYEVGAAVAFGYLGTTGASAQRTRKPLSEIAFDGVWGRPLHI